MVSGVEGSSPVCSVPDCGRKATARGWCYRHYVRWRKYGDPNVIKRPKTWAGVECAIEGCTAPVEAKGWCTKHYQRWKAHGDPLALARREKGSGSVTSQGYLILTRPQHPLTNARGLFAHREVLYVKIGPGDHACHWCGKPVSWDLIFPESANALVVDHVDHDKQNNEPANLVPSCGECNIKRASP
jgi:hypothetical protein